MSVTTVQAAMSGVPLALLIAATTGTGTPIAIPPSFITHSFLLVPGAGVSSGTIQLETANDPNDANTWPTIDGKATGTTNAFTIASTADQIIQFSGRLMFVRARVTTVVGGGNVTLNYLGGKNY